MVWIRLFNGSDALVAVDVGAQERGTLFGTVDGGRTWRHSPLPAGYIPDPPTITFPDSRHGWVYIGRGAMGSMSVTMFATSDGGKRWTQVACARLEFEPTGCRRDSGIGFGGDKTFLTFANDQSGWLVIHSNGGVPALLHTSDGGRTWHDQHVGLPPRVHWPSVNGTIFPMGDLDEPHISGHIGLMAESVGFYRPKPRATWSRLYVYRSMDAGNTWRLYQRTPVSAPSMTQHASAQEPQIQFVDTRNWIGVVGNTIWRTANAGGTWSHAVMHVPSGLQLVLLTFADPSHGWAEAAPRSQIGGLLGGTALLQTSDAGRNWSHVAVP